MLCCWRASIQAYGTAKVEYGGTTICVDARWPCVILVLALWAYGCSNVRVQGVAFMNGVPSAAHGGCCLLLNSDSSRPASASSAASLRSSRTRSNARQKELRD